MMEKEMAELVNRLKSRLNSCLYPAKQAKRRHDSLEKTLALPSCAAPIRQSMLRHVTAINLVRDFP